MKKAVVVLMISLFLACETNAPKKPDNLIPKDKMILVLRDIAIVNATKSIDKKKLEENNILPVEYVYKKHNIDSAQFAESNTYYSYNAKKYKELFEKVEANLKELQIKFKAEEKTAKRKDSIAKAKKAKLKTLETKKS